LIGGSAAAALRWLVVLAALATEAASALPRVVSLAPHLTENLFAIGAGAALVGVSDHSDYPAAAAQIPRVGSATAVDLERLLTLQPAWLLIWSSGTPPLPEAQLAALGIQIFRSEPREPAAIADEIEQLGLIVGRPEAAAAVAAAFRQRLAQLQRDAATDHPRRLFYPIWDQPLFTIGGRHLISAAITQCGGRNIFAAVDALAPQVSIEAVLTANPERIVADRREVLAQWRQYPQISAVANDGLRLLNPDLIQRPGVRFIDGMSQLCAALR